MNKVLFNKTIKVWLLFMVLAIVNGIIRNGVYKPIVGDLLAHQISSVIFILVIFIITFMSLHKLPLLPSRDLLLMGAVWFFATEGFEFIAGHYAFGNSWEKLLADYNIFAGRIWILVLLTILFAPYITGRFLQKSKPV